MLQSDKINRDAFKYDLHLAKCNEKKLNTKIHHSIANRIDNEIMKIEFGEYDEVMSHYDEEVFNDYIIG